MNFKGLIIFIVLLLDLAAESRDVMYADVRIMNRQTGADPVSFEVRTANYTGADPVYSEVKIPQVPERGRDLERKILKGCPANRREAE
ncbi:hypothetical protein UPYG_G00246860 [Umbra pygmaea]|uniref:Uncharacterized protein n=1 Tax=Umbra pygmaea TaxID=75934 RepID=A0ABD0X6X4_UMBPY